jgi:hypothetical protein
MTKPRHANIPSPGAIAVILEQAAAAISLTPEAYLKLEAQGLMPKARWFPGLRRKAYSLKEVEAAFHALPVVGANDDDPDDPWSRVAV